MVDYGCGPGSYTFFLARMVGEAGKVYAVDIHPLAVRKIKDIVSRKHLKNVEAVCSDRETGLPDNSADVVLLYDSFHALNDPDGVLKELHRILKPGGILSFQDHRMTGDEITRELTKAVYFQLLKKGKKTYTFAALAKNK